MKRISLLRRSTVTASIICLIALSSYFQQTIMADVICSIETVTGFANSVEFDTNVMPRAGFTISLSGLGTDAEAGGTLDLTTFGDFSNAAEYIDVSIEGVSLGRLWDNNILNDSFIGNKVNNDRGQEYGTSPSGEDTNTNAIAQLTESQLDIFLSDGVLEVTLEAFGPEVNNLNAIDEDEEFITAKVTLNEAVATAVPEPSGWLVLTLVAMARVTIRSRKR